MAGVTAPDTSEFTLVRKKIILLLNKLDAHLEGVPVAIPKDENGNEQSIIVECTQDKERNLTLTKVSGTERTALQYSSDGDFLSLSRLESYASDSNPRAGTLKKIVEFHAHIWPEASQVFSDQNAGTKKYGATLGFSADEVSIIIDRSVHAKPTFTTFTLSPSIAERFVKHYGGLYLLYRLNVIELSDDEKIPVVSKCVLSIRNPIPGTRKGNRRVRCKLLVPSLPLADTAAQSSLYKYDGFISPHKQDILKSDDAKHERYNHACTWLFQQRHIVGEDNITDSLMIISLGIPGMHRDAPVTGNMLTLSQGENRTRKPYTGSVLIYRIDETRRVPLETRVIPDDQTYFRLQSKSTNREGWQDRQDADFDTQLVGFFFPNKEAKIRVENSRQWSGKTSLQEIHRSSLDDKDIDAELRLLSSSQ